MPDEQPPGAEEKALPRTLLGIRLLAFYILLTASEKRLLGYRKGNPERPEQESPSLFSKVMQRIEGAIYRQLHVVVPSRPPPVRVVSCSTHENDLTPTSPTTIKENIDEYRNLQELPKTSLASFRQTCPFQGVSANGTTN